MSKLSTYLESHASLINDAATVLNLLLGVAPLPPVVKTTLSGIVTEMQGTANNLHENANTIEQQLTQDVLNGLQGNDTVVQPSAASPAAPVIQAATTALAASSATHAALVAAAATPATPPAPTAPVLQPVETQPAIVPQHPAPGSDPFARFRHGASG